MTVEQAIEQCLYELIKYTQSHFTAEEEAMEKCSFPGLKEHKAEQDEFVKRIKHLPKEYQAGILRWSSPVFNTVRKWVQTYMVNTDKEYILYLSGMNDDE